MERAFYTVREFCERNAISKRWFYVLVNRKVLWIAKFGHKTFVPAACEQAWHERLQPAHIPAQASNVHSNAQANMVMHIENALTSGRK